MDYNEIGKIIRCLTEYMETYAGKRDLVKLSSLLKSSSSDFFTGGIEDFDKKIINLIYECEERQRKAVILILKNKKKLFDMFIFKNEVSFAPINVVSSEAFQDTLRRKPVDGYIIENVIDEDILVFLKAYYIYRRSPKLSSTINNMVFEYGYDCLEMASIKEKFNGIILDEEINLESIIVYDNDALPYHLGYLDEYRKQIEELRNNNHRYSMRDAVMAVRNDRFIGMSLRRY